MFSPLLLLTFLGLLAGRVLAQAQTFPTFNITVGTLPTVNLTTAQILNISSTPVLAPCAANLADAQSKISACGQDPSCLCNSDTVTSFYTAELCMLHTLIAANKPAPNSLAGNNVVVGAYAAACAHASFQIPLNQSKLTVPDNWDGPVIAILPSGSLIPAVIIGGILGLSALYLMSNIE